MSIEHGTNNSRFANSASLVFYYYIPTHTDWNNTMRIVEGETITSILTRSCSISFELDNF